MRYENTGPEIWDQTGRNPNAFVYATDIEYAKWVELKESAAGSLPWSEFGTGRRHCEQPDPRAVLWQDGCNSRASAGDSWGSD